MQMYQSSLGLTAGMRLTTERGGPYRLLGISAPFTFQIMGFDMLIIYHQSVVVVSIEYIDEPHSLGHTPSISPIGRDDDGTYWTEQNDQIWPSEGDSGLQLDMFRLEPPPARAYAFQAGVDYDAADKQIWHCAMCGHDFNTTEPARPVAPRCPACKAPDLALQIVMMRDVPRDKAKASSYQRKLGLTDDRLVKVPPPLPGADLNKDMLTRMGEMISAGHWSAAQAMIDALPEGAKGARTLLAKKLAAGRASAEQPEVAV